MPELPEVETVRGHLAPALEGRTFDRVEIRDYRLVMPEEPVAVAAELEGEEVAAVGRRGKYLVVRFESDRVLLIHLRMTGSLLHVDNGSPDPDAYTRAVVRLDDGSDVIYRDVRRFGTWRLLEPEEVVPYLAKRLGKEPLERFSSRDLRARLAGRRAPLKTVLLDQRVVAGLGNIYADEALWRARINPLRPAESLTREEAGRLHRAIRQALRTGIARQGSTLRDYARPDGSAGSMQTEFRVYGRDGQPCPRCRTPIAKARVAGRGAWFCPRCQP